MPAYVTPSQLAERWSCSSRHIRDLIAAGRLRGMRLGLGAWRIAVADVEAYELARTNRPAEVPPTAQPIRPAFGVLEETGIELPLPERWWEGETGTPRSRTKKTAASSN